MRRFLDRLYDAAGALAAFFIFAIFVVMLGAAAARELGLRSGGTDDLVSWMTAAAAFLGMAHTFRHGDFVRVGLFLEAMPAGRRRVFELFSLTVAAIFIGYLLWSVALLIGVGLLFMAVLDAWFTVLRGEKPRYVTEVEARHARGDFSEDV